MNGCSLKWSGPCQAEEQRDTVLNTKTQSQLSLAPPKPPAVSGLSPTIPPSSWTETKRHPFHCPFSGSSPQSNRLHWKCPSQCQPSLCVCARTHFHLWASALLYSFIGVSFGLLSFMVAPFTSLMMSFNWCSSIIGMAQFFLVWIWDNYK